MGKIDTEIIPVLCLVGIGILILIVDFIRYITGKYEIPRLDRYGNKKRD